MKMEGLDEVLLALSASETSTNQQIEHNIQWTHEIGGSFYELKASEGVGSRLTRFCKNFPRNVFCFRGILVPISILYFPPIDGGSVALFIIPRSLAVIRPPEDRSELNRNPHSLSVLAFESYSKCRQIEQNALSTCSALTSICIPSGVEILE
jgi:hypothetical protein